MRRLLTAATGSLMMVSLATSVAFAGGPSGGGLHNDKGNHTGNENKKDTRNCPNDYEPYYIGNTISYSYEYDLNDNGVVCIKWVDDHYSVIDDVSGQVNEA